MNWGRLWTWGREGIKKLGKSGDILGSTNSYTRRVKIYYGIWWLKKELFMVHGTLQTFYRNKTFLFVKIESWNFQQLFDLGFCKTLQNFSSLRQTFRQHFSTGNKSCPNELKLCEISRNDWSKRCWKYQIFIVTNKKVLFVKKILIVPCTMDSSFFSQQMAPWCPNFPHQRLWYWP